MKVFRDSKTLSFDRSLLILNRNFNKNHRLRLEELSGEAKV